MGFAFRGFQDKSRGRLVAGRLCQTEAVVLGSPQTRSVAAISLDGKQMWNYETARKGDDRAGINDIAIGSADNRPIVVVGTVNGVVYILSEDGKLLDKWGYNSTVTNVACGQIKGKNAIAVGLYVGHVLTYLNEPS